VHDLSLTSTLNQKVNSTTSGFVKDKQLTYCIAASVNQVKSRKPAPLIEGGGGSIPVFLTTGAMSAYGPDSDMPVALANVRSWGKSGPGAKLQQVRV
jgi:hypothetical protein